MYSTYIVKCVDYIQRKKKGYSYRYVYCITTKKTGMEVMAAGAIRFYVCLYKIRYHN